MSVRDTDGVVAAAKLGVSRVVVARELSLDNIKSAVDNSPCEIETFLHGALCVCHSGQCLFSSMVGGRSGNRGECAQPCRLPFNNGKYILSLRDLSLAEHIPELIESGVSSLKIEGRMKSPDYVYTVTSVYRRLLK
jgi:putative protease